MREIKFRAWDKENQVMVYDVNVQDGKPVKRGYQWFNTENTIWNSELQQYTGLRDRNGREIYEGDIVSMFGGTQFSVVEWDDKFGLYRIYLQLSGASDVGEELLGNHLNVVEVIGNIYENPELIER